MGYPIRRLLHIAFLLELYNLLSFTPRDIVAHVFDSHLKRCAMAPIPADLTAFLAEQRDSRAYRRALAVKLVFQG